jgi:hypothetical protein
MFRLNITSTMEKLLGRMGEDFFPDYPGDTLDEYSPGNIPDASPGSSSSRVGNTEEHNILCTRANVETVVMRGDFLFLTMLLKEEEVHHLP